jgi:hypothetical protein
MDIIKQNPIDILMLKDPIKEIKSIESGASIAN